MVEFIARLSDTSSTSVMLRADVAIPDLTSSFYDLVDAAQTTNGMIVIGAVLLCAWLAFRAFR